MFHCAVKRDKYFVFQSILLLAHSDKFSFSTFRLKYLQRKFSIKNSNLLESEIKELQALA